MGNWMPRMDALETRPTLHGLVLVQCLPCYYYDGSPDVSVKQYSNISPVAGVCGFGKYDEKTMGSRNSGSRRFCEKQPRNPAPSAACGFAPFNICPFTRIHPERRVKHNKSTAFLSIYHLLMKSGSTDSTFEPFAAIPHNIHFQQFPFRMAW
ncbi:hypothetical protein BC832DRAFT_362116 [Gaertneriomyces semiglobifer]|nr:hypothetical protein BC832DRAFT_362116 [Gaertneriomyces semiglobifer]